MVAINKRRLQAIGPFFDIGVGGVLGEAVTGLPIVSSGFGM